MAEARAFEVVDSTIDEVLNRGATILYDQYLIPKKKPYTSLWVAAMLRQWSCVSANSYIDS